MPNPDPAEATSATQDDGEQPASNRRKDGWVPKHVLVTFRCSGTSPEEVPCRFVRNTEASRENRPSWQREAVQDALWEAYDHVLATGHEVMVYHPAGD